MEARGGEERRRWGEEGREGRVPPVITVFPGSRGARIVPVFMAYVRVADHTCATGINCSSRTMSFCI